MDKICKNCQHWKPLTDSCKVEGCAKGHDVIRTTDHCDDDFLAVEPKKVYLIEEGDSHLSKASRVLMGVFDSKEELEKGARKLITERVKDNFSSWEWREKDCTEEEAVQDFIDHEVQVLMDDYQTHYGKVLFLVSEATLNDVEEIR